MEPVKYRQAYEATKKADKILLVTHDRPDGDGLACVCAMIEFLTGLNKPCFAFCQDPPPHQFSFLPHIEKIRSDKKEFNFADFDLIIALDCGGLNRTNLAKEIKTKRAGQTIIEFDHHPKIDSYADIEVKEAGLSATAETLYRFFKTNRLPINKTVANCLLTGIMTDTANFFHDSTSDRTIEIASDLLLRGARFPVIHDSTWRNKSLPAMRLWGEAINNLKINSAYRLAYSVLPLGKLADADVTEEELEGLSSFLANLEGVNALLLLREEARGRLKGSLRTVRSGVDISRLAQLLGGGGHPKASGFTLDFNLEKTNGRWQIV